jgi:hypothetical protein
MKSGRLNLLELSGPHRTSYGTPLPFFNISRLMLFREVIGNYSENYMKNTKILVVKEHYLLRISAVVHVRGVAEK